MVTVQLGRLFYKQQNNSYKFIDYFTEFPYY